MIQNFDQKWVFLSTSNFRKSFFEHKNHNYQNFLNLKALFIYDFLMGKDFCFIQYTQILHANILNSQLKIWKIKKFFLRTCDPKTMNFTINIVKQESKTLSRRTE